MSPPRRAPGDLRRVARVSYQVWRTHMRACVAEYNFRGRVTESEPEPYLATTRPGRTKRFLLSFSHRPALLLSGPRGFFAPLLIFLRALFYFWVDRFVDRGTRT